MEDPFWYINSRDSAHATNNSGILLNLQPYNNSEQLLVSDGNDLQIVHVRSVKLTTLLPMISLCPSYNQKPVKHF